jgi:integrase
LGKLTASAVRGFKAAGKYSDGDGLTLLIDKAGRRYWTFRYMRDGRARSMSLGNADLMSLAEARAAHQDARKLLRDGTDPLAARQAKADVPAVVTFREAAEAYIATHQAGWRGANTLKSWRHAMLGIACPVIGRKPVGEIGTVDVLKVLKPIWQAKPVTAVQVRMRLEAVLDYARAMHWRDDDNPARWKGTLQPVLPAHGKVHTVEHHAALDWREAPALMAKLADDPSMAARCLRFLMLTATRSGEARGARWAEIDLDAAVWTIPGGRMKTAKEHRVPLSDAALALLDELPRTETPLVFFGFHHGQALDGTTLSKLMRRLGHDCTVHGFRSCFRDWCADHGKPWDVAEAALAHVAGSAVVRAYQRSDLLDQRRVLMDAWARFLTQPPAEVIPLQPRIATTAA